MIKGGITHETVRQIGGLNPQSLVITRKKRREKQSEVPIYGNTCMPYSCESYGYKKKQNVRNERLKDMFLLLLLRIVLYSTQPEANSA